MPLIISDFQTHSFPKDSARSFRSMSLGAVIYFQKILFFFANLEFQKSPKITGSVSIANCFIYAVLFLNWTEFPLNFSPRFFQYTNGFFSERRQLQRKLILVCFFHTGKLTSRKRQERPKRMVFLHIQAHFCPNLPPGLLSSLTRWPYSFCQWFFTYESP